MWPRVLVDMDQLRETSPVFRIADALENFLYRRAAVIVVMADGTRSDLQGRGIPAEKLVYIPNAADPDFFRPSAERNVLRDVIGFERFTAVYAGAHGPANGLELLLDAAAAVSDLDVDIVLVGGGVSKASLVAEAATRGLSNVRFIEPMTQSLRCLTSLLPRTSVYTCWRTSTLFRSAVSPNKLFDYMAAGLPVITNCPG